MLNDIRLHFVNHKNWSADRRKTISAQITEFNRDLSLTLAGKEGPSKLEVSDGYLRELLE